VQTGDYVYCVSIVSGRLRVFGRVVAGHVARDDEHAESINVWAERGTETPFDHDGYDVADADADRVSYLHTDRSAHSIDRRDGNLVGYAFQGPNSVRELNAGHEALDRLVEP
jgi:hypothetical protein